MQRPVVVPRSLLPSVTNRRTRMGLIGSDTRLLVVTWSKLPAERPVSRLSRPVVLLSLVRAPAQPPQHAISGVDPTPRPAAVYASNAALPRRPQDSLPSCLLGFERTRLALASSYQLLLSHPASGFPTGFTARHTAGTEFGVCCRSSGRWQTRPAAPIGVRLRRRVKLLQKRPDAQGCSRLIANHRSSAPSKAHQK